MLMKNKLSLEWRRKLARSDSKLRYMHVFVCVCVCEFSHVLSIDRNSWLLFAVFPEICLIL